MINPVPPNDKVEGTTFNRVKATGITAINVNAQAPKKVTLFKTFLT